MKQVNARVVTRNKLITVVLVGVLFVLAGIAIAVVNRNGNVVARGNNSQGVSSSDQARANGTEAHVIPLEASKVSNSPATAKSLEYIIEEEKLAHDVYQAMYEKWGSRVFGNILKSEISHQNEVLAVMQNRNIADPRFSTIGKFKNQELQALYDKLIAQGNQSVSEAFRVGVAIEELDISDLKIAINSLNPADTDVKTAYETLLSGSQNHLTAFNRQLTR